MSSSSALIRTLVLLAVPAALSAGEIVHPLAVYRGAIHVDEEGAAKPAAMFPCIEAIRDKEAFAKFRARLPERAVSRTNPAPPNDDPLLKEQPINFESECGILITHNSLDQQFVDRIEKRERDLAVWAHFAPELGARPIGTGAYSLFVVQKEDAGGEPVLEKIDEDEVARDFTDRRAVVFFPRESRAADDPEVPAETAAAARRVARSISPIPEAWEVLIASGELVAEMPPEKAHALLGRPSHTRGATATWETDRHSREGDRALIAVVAPDGSYGGWAVVVLKR